ncbi:DUF7673 family protein [Vreelandella massiliensis]|uniref:DUF7673 family protein n=1 Tax=Vreelandella massiliensis TaxID=1816686 RepID=UPI001B314024|nr:hypothetical protein [Halomonas massiliensis]
MKIHHIKLDPSSKTALEALISVAQTDTGQAKVCADFLLAWHNPDENGGFAITDLWGLDAELADACTKVFQWLCEHSVYPDELGYGDEMKLIWTRWRSHA